MEPTPPPAGQRYRGVGGWLLLFYLVLTVILPLLSSSQLAVSVRHSAPSFNRHPERMPATIADWILRVTLISFSVYAGVGLWRIRPGAVPTVKSFLMCLLAYKLVALAWPFLTGLRSLAGNPMTQAVATGLLQALLFFAVWYPYFTLSRRVKATYGP
jgi:hypothetical protein